MPAARTSATPRLLGLFALAAIAAAIIGLFNTGHALAKPEINPADITWSTTSTVIDGQQSVGVTCTNNSPYRILSVQLQLGVKSGVSKDHVSDVLPGHQAKYFLKHGMDASIRRTIGSKSTSEASGVTADGTAVIGVNLDEIAEPDTMTIEFAGDDGKIYQETVDCQKGKTKVKTLVKDTDQWSKKDPAKLIPQPKGMLITDASISGKSANKHFSFSARDVSWDEFSAYVDACKNAGFTNVLTSSDTLFRATNDKGTHELSIDYQEQSMSLSGNLSAAQDATPSQLVVQINEPRNRTESSDDSVVDKLLYRAVDRLVDDAWDDTGGRLTDQLFGEATSSQPTDEAAYGMQDASDAGDMGDMQDVSVAREGDSTLAGGFDLGSK